MSSSTDKIISEDQLVKVKSDFIKEAQAAVDSQQSPDFKRFSANIMKGLIEYLSDFVAAVLREAEHD